MKYWRMPAMRAMSDPAASAETWLQRRERPSAVLDTVQPDIGSGSKVLVRRGSNPKARHLLGGVELEARITGCFGPMSRNQPE